jgi:hypothetical protein
MQVYEFMVPTHDNDGVAFSVEFNRFEAMLAEWFGGFTKLSPATGYWVNADGVAFHEAVIPYRVATAIDRESVRELVAPYIAVEFNQEAVYMGQIGSAEIIVYP